MIINSAALRSLYIGFSTAYQNAFSAVAPQYSRICQTVPSTTRSNEYGWMGQMPRIREWIGDRVVRDLATHGYTIRNRKFESTIGVDKDDIEDDNLGMYSTMFAEFGRSAATFPDELVFPFLKAGNTGICYDGQYFFDTDHPVLAEDGKTVTSVSNWGGGGGTHWFLMDLSRAVKPIVWQTRKPFNLVRKDREEDDKVFDSGKFIYGLDGRCNVGYGFWQLAYGSRQTLDAAAYEAARTAMMSFKADYGRPLGIMPNLLVVPPNLEGAARRILKNELNASGGTNEWAGTADVMVVPWLA